MLQEVIPNMHNGITIVKLSQELRFFDELFPFLFKERHIPIGIGNHRTLAVRGAAGKVFGEKLFDSHFNLQIQIEANIGDAKSALTQHTPDKIFPVEHSIRKMIYVFLLIRVVESTNWANFFSIGQHRHTTHAMICFN